MAASLSNMPQTVGRVSCAACLQEQMEAAAAQRGAGMPRLPRLHCVLGDEEMLPLASSSVDGGSTNACGCGAACLAVSYCLFACCRRGP